MKKLGITLVCASIMVSAAVYYNSKSQTTDAMESDTQTNFLKKESFLVALKNKAEQLALSEFTLEDDNNSSQINTIPTQESNKSPEIIVANKEQDNADRQTVDQQESDDLIQDDTIFNEQEELEKFYAFLDVIDDQLFREEKDEEWAYEQENKILALFEQEGLQGSSYMDSDCKTTLCRVKLIKSPTADRESITATIMHSPLFGDADGFIYDVEHFNDGSTEMSIVISRSGYGLPQMNQESL